MSIRSPFGGSDGGDVVVCFPPPFPPAPNVGDGPNTEFRGESLVTGKSHTSVGGNFRRTFRTIGPYEFPQEKVWTNDWSIWISPEIRMDQWRSKFSESFSLDRYWSIEGSSLSESLSAYCLCAKANSLSASQNSPSLPQNSVSSLFRKSTLKTVFCPFPKKRTRFLIVMSCLHLYLFYAAFHNSGGFEWTTPKAS